MIVALARDSVNFEILDEAELMAEVAATLGAYDCE
jgi:hypothetical protein